MKIRHGAVAALVLAMLPQVAHSQAARITPVLSDTMQRSCQAETANLLTMNGGQEVVGAQPSVERQHRSLRIGRSGDARLFEQTGSGPFGEILLRFRTTADGVVSEASLSGSSIDAYVAAAPGADLATLAAALADDVPERLLLGRSFVPGDNYYPEDLRRSLVNRLTSSLGLPFPVNGSIDVRYAGEVEERGRRAWRFAGEMAMRGSGDAGGRPASIDQTTRVEVLHDVETGLVLSYRTVAETRLDLDARPYTALRTTDAFDCDIVPVS